MRVSDERAQLFASRVVGDHTTGELAADLLDARRERDEARAAWQPVDPLAVARAALEAAAVRAVEAASDATAFAPWEEGSPADGGRLAADAIRTIDPAAIVAKVKP